MSTRGAAEIGRRQFLKISLVAGTGLTLGLGLPGCQETPPLPSTATPALRSPSALSMAAPATATASPSAWFEPNAYITIDNSGMVTLTVHRSEMGQGVQTALPMILAEELEVDLAQVRLVQAPADAKYGDQVTGGSRSIQNSFTLLLGAGAVARTMLIAAAAETWGVKPDECYAELGSVIHRVSGRKLGYGELVERAAEQPVPQQYTLKPSAEYRLIGTRQGLLDEPLYVTGRAIYGVDVRVPGMLYAVVARSPVFGGKLKAFDATAALAVPGVRDVRKIRSGVAVVAENTWSALQGRAALQVSWDEGDNAEVGSELIHARMVEEASATAFTELPNSGATRFVEAVYELPFLAHAALEPLSCTADITPERSTIWAPTQDRQAARTAARTPTTPEVKVPLIGGAFGRRLDVDYVPEAVELSDAMGAPVQVFWSREDDIQHDRYRPASYHMLRGGIDAQGLPVLWQHHIISQGIDGGGVSEGARGLPYGFKALVTSSLLGQAIPSGAWRSVYNANNAFATEAFLDELAAAVGQDPYNLRLALMKDGTPMRPVLQLAAERAGWGSTMPAGTGRGIACHSTWGVTHVAQVVEVEVSVTGALRVRRVVCAIDCGQVINPGMVEAQMEGGIVFALSAALRGEITFNSGRTQQRNFDDYPILRMPEMPTIEVYLLPSSRPPQGVGEMGVPPLAPALANAIFAATGKRLRKLPLRLG